MERSVALVALAAGAVALGVSVLRVWTHAVAVFGFEDARSWDTLRLIAVQSRWGQNWRYQAIAASIYTVACAATVWRREFWPTATLAVVGFTATIPLLGHAAGDPARMAVHMLHVLGAGVWLGALAVVLLLRSPKRIRFLILHRFAPIALPGVAVVVGAGLIASWYYVGAISNLWITTYGRVLVLKTMLVAGISVCGYVNWQRLRRLGGEAALSTVVLEATLAGAVVIVTGFLTEIGHP
jgi:putative copper resistance protein D